MAYLNRAGCFGEGTPVETEDGLQPIEAIRTGDLVWSIDPDSGEEGWHEVTQTFVHEEPALELILEEHGASETITVTGEHPFWERTRGWVGAGDLLPGDEVFTSRGGWARIGGGTWIDGDQLVYNLEVEGSHTYFVGETGAWVHNTCLNAAERSALAELRAGRDVSLPMESARNVLEASGLRPWTSGHYNPAMPAPRGTYRGDLLNTRNANAPYVHPPGSAPPGHAGNPHFNLHFRDGTRAAIILP